jgi:hypothetical protein
VYDLSLLTDEEFGLLERLLSKTAGEFEGDVGSSLSYRVRRPHWVKCCRRGPAAASF